MGRAGLLHPAQPERTDRVLEKSRRPDAVEHAPPVLFSRASGCGFFLRARMLRRACSRHSILNLWYSRF
ncbi:hypothetical protein DQK91_07895 [Oceanidesulfovibrio marinus]|uniref:Uncharacterized protein n=1 Tax=Oceanidesulfovibrio marinus TaxID=370038 RepID=A0A6P1ZI91_9BACT|nr:hypothetical protein DQK91_07895 [Oceanidesulfovibrio marinus]